MQVLLQVVKVDLLISLLKLYHIQHWEQDINQGNDKSKEGYISLHTVGFVIQFSKTLLYNTPL